MYALSAPLTLICLLLVWMLAKKRSSGQFWILVIGSLIAVGLSSTSLWQAIAAGYERDSFFDLGIGGRAGVLTITSLGAFLLFAVLRWKSRLFITRLPSSMVGRIALLFVDIAIGIGIFGVLHAISPQLYYTVYQQVYPDLPNQIVIKTLFNTEGLLRMVQLKAADSLSNHSSGIVLLSIIPFTCLSHATVQEQQKYGFLIALFAGLTLVLVNFF